MTAFYLLTDTGVTPIPNDDPQLRVTARIAVSKGDLVVDQMGRPLEPPLKHNLTSQGGFDDWWGRFPS